MKIGEVIKQTFLNQRQLGRTESVLKVSEWLNIYVTSKPKVTWLHLVLSYEELFLRLELKKGEHNNHAIYFKQALNEGFTVEGLLMINCYFVLFVVNYYIIRLK